MQVNFSNGCVEQRAGTGSLDLFRRHREIRRGFVQDYALDRVKLSLPRGLPECSHCGLIAGLSAHADSGWSEIDILGVILVFETRRQEAHDMHLRHTPVAGQLPDRVGLAHIIGKIPNELADDVAQSMRLLLPRDVVCNTARVLDVLLTMQHFSD